MKKLLTPFVAFSALALAGCGEGLGPGNASEQEQQEIQALMADLPYFAEDFGDESAATSPSVVASGSYLMAEASAEAPQNWIRRRGLPVKREVNIVVENGIATVTRLLEFDGSFIVFDRENDARHAKPLQETLQQTAVFQRLDSAEVNTDTGRKHRWKLIEISPAELVMTDPAKQTVNIKSVKVDVDGIVDAVSDASLRYDFKTRAIRVRDGALVTVMAEVENMTSDPATTYVYLHLYHASPGLRVWRRVPMAFDAETGTWVAQWRVEHAGRERIIVDALDGGSFSLNEEDTYRANAWAIPYRMVEDGETDR